MKKVTFKNPYSPKEFADRTEALLSDGAKQEIDALFRKFKSDCGFPFLDALNKTNVDYIKVFENFSKLDIYKLKNIALTALVDYLTNTDCVIDTDQMLCSVLKSMGSEAYKTTPEINFALSFPQITSPFDYFKFLRDELIKLFFSIVRVLLKEALEEILKVLDCGFINNILYPCDSRVLQDSDLIIDINGADILTTTIAGAADAMGVAPQTYERALNTVIGVLTVRELRSLFHSIINHDIRDKVRTALDQTGLENITVEDFANSPVNLSSLESQPAPINRDICEQNPLDIQREILLQQGVPPEEINSKLEDLLRKKREQIKILCNKYEKQEISLNNVPPPPITSILVEEGIDNIFNIYQNSFVSFYQIKLKEELLSPTGDLLLAGIYQYSSENIDLSTKLQDSNLEEKILSEIYNENPQISSPYSYISIQNKNFYQRYLPLESEVVSLNISFDNEQYSFSQNNITTKFQGLNIAIGDIVTIPVSQEISDWVEQNPQSDAFRSLLIEKTLNEPNASVLFENFEQVQILKQLYNTYENNIETDFIEDFFLQEFPINESISIFETTKNKLIEKDLLEINKIKQDIKELLLGIVENTGQDMPEQSNQQSNNQQDSILTQDELDELNNLRIEIKNEVDSI